MTPSAGTALAGVIGRPVAQSLGPAMHNAAFRAMGLDAVYLAFDSPDPAGCLAGARALGVLGLSVTMPHKTAILPLLDHVDPQAVGIGAVNTVVNDGGRLAGFNTDTLGILEAVRTRIEPRGLTALVVGAGGAGRAAAWALAGAGARLFIANRSRERGEALARSIPCPYVSPREALDLELDLLVQASSVGMAGGASGNAGGEADHPRDASALRSGAGPPG